jgi:hypothetical protein
LDKEIHQYLLACVLGSLTKQHTIQNIQLAKPQYGTTEVLSKFTRAVMLLTYYRGAKLKYWLRY